MVGHRIRQQCLALVATWLAAVVPAAAQQPAAPGFVAPPRTISDITAILDQQKPDPAAVAKLRELADAKPPEGASPADLVDFLFRRGMAAEQLGRAVQKRADMKESVRIGRGAGVNTLQSVFQWAEVENRLGNQRLANQLYEERLAMVLAANSQGNLPAAYSNLAAAYVRAGDLVRAHDYAEKAAKVVNDELSNNRNWSLVNENWRAQVERARALIAMAEGRYTEAEQFQREAVALSEKTVEKAPMLSQLGVGNQAIYENFREVNIFDLAAILEKQRRLVEAEVEARRALLSQLKRRGKYASETANGVSNLGRILSSQGRAAEAQKLFEVAAEIYRETGAEQS